MATNELFLEKCLQKLKNLSRKYNGYLTYNDISRIFSTKTNEASIEVIDLLYEALLKEDIKIVDQIPDNIAPSNGNSLKEVRVLYKNINARHSLDRYRLLYTDFTCDPFQEISYCPEETLDNLLDLALKKNNILNLCDILAIKEVFNLSTKELYYLCEYIISRGVTIHGLNNIFKSNILYNSFYNNDEEAQIRNLDLFYDSILILGGRAIIAHELFAT